MNSLEVERQKNIRRNQEHLRELGIYRKHEAVRPASEKKNFKRQKLFHGQPSRASARIASATSVPIYSDKDEETKIPVIPHKKTKDAPTKKAEPAKDANTAVRLPVDNVEGLPAHWPNWTPSADPPFRDEESTFHFESHPDFTPNKSPEEMLREGCFGGSYFRPLYSRHLGITVADDYKELPPAWIDGVDVNKFLTSPEYNPDVNKFKVSCGQSIEEWEAAGWIRHAFDVRGWFQWYCRFFMGRRCEDDERQVGRWKRCVGENGRWRRLLLKKYVALGIKEVFDDGEDEEGLEVSPVMHQTCFHWALEIRQTILDRHWKRER
ncbi:MAG: hypothetical protein LQ343_007988 [Gyalolechia ehrenbergii]|nr:MAG: hypothetical protein LQ343_007988 [Gyalolechia ehrenbergii]